MQSSLEINRWMNCRALNCSIWIHALETRSPKISEMVTIASPSVMKPSGGRRGRALNTKSGHKKWQIAKYRSHLHCVRWFIQMSLVESRVIRSGICLVAMKTRSHNTKTCHWAIVHNCCNASCDHFQRKNLVLNYFSRGINYDAVMKLANNDNKNEIV